VTVDRSGRAVHPDDHGDDRRGLLPHAEDTKPTSWRNPTVIGMGLTSFFSDLGHETATAVLPLFLASIGAPPAALGVIEGVSDATSSFVKLGAGWIGDRIPRRKPIVVGGYALTGIATTLFGLATAWPHILISRAIGWFGRGIRGPLRDARLASIREARLFTIGVFAALKAQLSPGEADDI
jgi:MFS family permease